MRTLAILVIECNPRVARTKNKGRVRYDILDIILHGTPVGPDINASRKVFSLKEEPRPEVCAEKTLR